jgi:hypothetical protein
MKTKIFATQKSDIGKKNIPVKLSKGGKTGIPKSEKLIVEVGSGKDNESIILNEKNIEEFFNLMKREGFRDITIHNGSELDMLQLLYAPTANKTKRVAKALDYIKRQEELGIDLSEVSSGSGYNSNKRDRIEKQINNLEAQINNSLEKMSLSELNYYYEHTGILIEDILEWRIEESYKSGGKINWEDFAKGGRVSPSDSATLYEIGTVHRSDNDGNLWIVKADKNGRKSWRRYKEPIDELEARTAELQEPMPSETVAEESSLEEKGALSRKVIEDIVETESDLNFLYLDNIDGAKGIVKNQELAKEIRKETNELNDFKRVLFKDYFDPDKAIVDYFAKAANPLRPVFMQNKPTPEGIQEKLDELQTLPSFKRWFGDFEDESARTSVVKRNGKPLIVYHGTATQTPFSRFDMGKFPVMYFAADYDYAKWFANFGDGIVYPVVLDIKYLFDLSFFGTQEMLWAELRNTAKEEYGVDLPRKHPVFPAQTKKKAWEWLRHDLPHQTLINAVKEAGYTGMKHVENNPNDLKEDGKERTTYAYMIFDPNQAKSILSNNLTRPNSNILFMSKGGTAKIKRSLSDKIKRLKK